MFFPNNRDALLQKGGSSDKVQHFRDDKLNDLLTGISAAVEPQQRLQLTGDAQRHLDRKRLCDPDFRRAAGVRRRAVGERR